MERQSCDLDFGRKDYVSNIHKEVRSRIQIVSNRMKEYYDIRPQEGGYRQGNLDWLRNPQSKKGLSPILQQHWDGPYQVTKRINDVVYRFRKEPHGKLRVVYFNYDTPYATNKGVDIETVRSQGARVV